MLVFDAEVYVTCVIYIGRRVDYVGILTTTCSYCTVHVLLMCTANKKRVGVGLEVTCIGTPCL